MTAPPAALLLAAHGDGGSAPRDDAVRGFARSLAGRLGVAVAWAVLKRPATFALARAHLGAAPVAVMPLFMAEGRFVRLRLPALLAEHGFAGAVRLPVLGLDPGLAAIAERRVREAGPVRRIVLVAHGSGSGDGGSRSAAEGVAAGLAARLGRAVEVAFIEEAPRFDAVITGGDEMVIGLFASVGTHAVEDVAAHVARVGGVAVHIAAIGTDPEVADLVEAGFRRAVAAGV